MNKDLKEKITQTLLISSEIFTTGKQTLTELIGSLEETGLSEKEARETANELFNTAKKNRENFAKKFISELQHLNLSKKEVKEIEEALKKISNQPTQ